VARCASRYSLFCWGGSGADLQRLGSLIPPKQRSRPGHRRQMVTRGDLEIVECLLPAGALAGYVHLPLATPPVRTTTSDCRIRGGEFVAYDRADYKSPCASGCRPPKRRCEAAEQCRRNLRARSGDVSTCAAAIWYQKAADQHYSRASSNLGPCMKRAWGRSGSAQGAQPVSPGVGAAADSVNV